MRLLSGRAGSLGWVAATTLFCCSQYEGEGGQPVEDAGTSDAGVVDPDAATSDAGSTGPAEVPPYRARLLADVTTRPAGSSPAPLLVGSDYTLLLGNDAGGRRVWVTRGTANTTTALPISADARLDNYYVAAADGAGAYVYRHVLPGPSQSWGVSVWHTDGTVAGTRFVRDVDFGAGRWGATLPPYFGTSPGLFAVGSRFCVISTPAGSTSGPSGLLQCIDAVTGTERRYDGVTAVVAHQGVLLLGQVQGEPATPRLVSTDGASEPTVLATDVTLVGGVSTASGAVLHVRGATQGDELARYGAGGYALWEDGYAGPTSSVERVYGAGGRAFAALYTSEAEPRLPRLADTDGSAAGTRFLEDPLPGTPLTVTEVIAHGTEMAYWAVVPSTSERRLFATTGLASAGVPSVRLLTQHSTSASGFLSGVSLGSSIVFGLGLPASGTELWSVQSTTGAAALVRDLFEGQSGLVGAIVPAGAAAAFACQTPATGPELCLTNGRTEATAVTPLAPTWGGTAGTDSAAASNDEAVLLALNASSWSQGELVSVSLSDGTQIRHDVAGQLAASLRSAQVRRLGADAFIVHYAQLSQGDRLNPSPPLLLVRRAGAALAVTPGPGVAVLGEATKNGVLVSTGTAWSYWNGVGELAPLQTAARQTPAGSPVFYRIGDQVLAAFSSAGELRGTIQLFRVDDALLVPLANYSVVAQAEVSSVLDVGEELLVFTDRGIFRTKGIPDDFVEVTIPEVPSDLVEASPLPLRTARMFHAAGTALYRSIQRTSQIVNDVLPYEGLYAIRDGGYVALSAGRTRWARALGEVLVVGQQIDGDRRTRIVAVSPNGVEVLAAGIEFNTGANQLFVAAGRLYFTHDDGEHGRELWVTNGTRAGTMLTADVAPGKASAFAGSDGEASRVVGQRGDGLVLLGDDFTHGTEPLLLEPYSSLRGPSALRRDR